MLQEEDRVASVVRDVVLSELSWIVAQPREVIALGDHLVHTIHADANDLSFDFIPFVERAFQVNIPASSWCEACTVAQVCDLLASHYRQKPAHERAAVEARLAKLRASPRSAEDSRPRYYWRLSAFTSYQPSYWYSPYARGRRLGRFWRSWRPGARALRRALRSGAVFGPKSALATVDDSDPVFLLVRDAVFWLLEACLEKPRSTLSLDDDVTELPYIGSAGFADSFCSDIEYMLQVHPSQREWSSSRTVREICGILVRHFNARPPDVREEIAAHLGDWKLEEYNEPPPRRWWQVWRWELPRWPV